MPYEFSKAIDKQTYLNIPLDSSPPRVPKVAMPIVLFMVLAVGLLLMNYFRWF